MPWFKRKEETYNEQLLREAGLDRPPPPPLLDPAVLGMGARPAEWEVYATAEDAGVAGDAVSFVALPDGTLIVEDEEGDASISSFADAIERQLQPPYRAIGRREDGALWSLAARRIDVRRLERDGDEFEEVENEAVTRGTRLDGDLWEIRVDRL